MTTDKTTYQAERKVKFVLPLNTQNPQNPQNPQSNLSGKGKMSCTVVTALLSAVTTQGIYPQVGTVKGAKIFTGYR